MDILRGIIFNKFDGRDFFICLSLFRFYFYKDLPYRKMKLGFTFCFFSHFDDIELISDSVSSAQQLMIHLNRGWRTLKANN
jgi:hypothetical protein